MLEKASSLHSDNVLFMEFLRRAEDIQKIALQLGITVTPLFNFKNPHFLRATQKNQEAILERLKIYKNLFQTAAEDDGFDEKKLLWLAVKLLGFAPHSGLMNLIGDGDYIEIYVDNVQAYRSFNYYSCVSYSLDELENVPWDQLFKRDQAMSAHLFADLAKAIETRDIVESLSPEHEVVETDSPFQNRIHYKLKYIAPLKDREGGNRNCIVTVVKARLVSTAPPEEREEKLIEYYRKLKIME